MKTIRVGDHAFLLLVDDPRAAVAARQLVLDIASDSGDGGLVAPVDVVPAARTVLVGGLPGATDVAAWRSRLAEELPPGLGLDKPTTRQRSLTLDVTYNGADLDAVADAWACSRDAVVERHQATAFLVAFCGFAPGFAYCVPNTPHLLPDVPRRPEPRERVPAGSVALAGEYCGIYPAAMPGGWQLIGVTSAVLFDPDRAAPALLSPGDTVRFRLSR